MNPRAAAVRRLSGLIFGGAQYRIEVGAELVSGQEFYALDLVALLGDPPGKGSVHTELKRLREAKLIFETERGRSSRAKPLVPATSSLWDVCRELRARAWADADRETAIAGVLREAAKADAALGMILFGQPSNLSDGSSSIRTYVREAEERR